MSFFDENMTFFTYFLLICFERPTYYLFSKISIIVIFAASITSVPFDLLIEGVHLTLLPHIFSVQLKSGAYYIKGQWGRVQNKIKET